MKTLIKLVLLLSLAASAHATTWYVRTDGGNRTQCTGKANAAYPGTGTAKACAFKHPFWLLDQNTWKWNIAGGDTVQFGDQGPYYMGLGPFKGLGQEWARCHGNSADCDLPSGIPSGTAANPTRFLGANAGHCGTGYTQLIGIQGAFWIMALEGTEWMDTECLEFTQADHCTKVGLNPTNITSTEMNAGTATYGWTKGYYAAPYVGELVTITGTTNGGGAFNIANKQIASITGTNSGTFTVTGLSGTYPKQPEKAASDFAGVCTNADNFSTYGLVFAYRADQGPSNATIKDIYVHGISSSGTLGSHFNRTKSDSLNMSNIRIFGNGLAGFDSDGGGCHTDCESTGTMNIANLDAEWNGCIQISPGVYSYCVDQAFGGNGDNLVMIATGGTWNWSHITTKFGMQDCFDSLHSGDDPANLPTINGSYIYSEGCEGAAIKMSGGNVTLRNSIGIANCKVMLTASNFPKNPPGWNALLGSPCRANDAFVLTASDGHTLTVQNVDNIGEHSVGWDIVPIGPTGCSGPTCLMIFQNNATLGFPIGNGANMAGLYLADLSIDPFKNTGSSASNNSWFNVKGGCPSDRTYEKNAVCGDPLFVSEKNINAINAALTGHSPLRGAGIFIAATSSDFNGATRPSTPSIGYVDYSEGAPAPPNPGTASTPVIINSTTGTAGATVIR